MSNIISFLQIQKHGSKMYLYPQHWRFTCFECGEHKPYEDCDHYRNAKIVEGNKVLVEAICNRCAEIKDVVNV